jgi:hypothetical protein
MGELSGAHGRAITEKSSADLRSGSQAKAMASQIKAQAKPSAWTPWLGSPPSSGDALGGLHSALTPQAPSEVFRLPTAYAAGTVRVSDDIRDEDREQAFPMIVQMLEYGNASRVPNASFWF